MILKTQLDVARQEFYSRDEQHSHWQYKRTSQDLGEIETHKLDITTVHIHPVGNRLFVYWFPGYVTDDPMLFSQYVEAHVGKEGFVFVCETTSKYPEGESEVSNLWLPKGRPVPPDKNVYSGPPKTIRWPYIDKREL